ncbi:MAG: nucleoside triphosphate hydrolase [Gammaproteobacteria bacterium]|nr:nucleoside triphosphate hydrolase [Gammaproteobacteria bacterium]
MFKKLISLENKANDFGFKWETSQQIIEQIKSEIAEICIHLQDGDKKKLQEEMGDLLHATFSLCVFNHLDPEQTLQQSIEKFERRFTEVERLTKASGLENLNGQSFSHIMKLWSQAKNK